MKCEDRDPDLLLYGLGELPLREGWKNALHLMTCSRCRARQTSLIAANRHIAEALRPNAGEGGGGHPRAPLNRSLRIWIAPYFLLAILGILMITAGVVGYVHSHSVSHATTKDDGCTPGLNSDQCR